MLLISVAYALNKKTQIKKACVPFNFVAYSSLTKGGKFKKSSFRVRFGANDAW